MDSCYMMAESTKHFLMGIDTKYQLPQVSKGFNYVLLFHFILKSYSKFGNIGPDPNNFFTVKFEVTFMSR